MTNKNFGQNPLPQSLRRATRPGYAGPMNPGMGAPPDAMSMGVFQQPDWNAIFGPSLDRFQVQAHQSNQPQGPLGMGGGRPQMGVNTQGGLGGMLRRALGFWFGGQPSQQQQVNLQNAFANAQVTPNMGQMMSPLRRTSRR